MQIIKGELRRLWSRGENELGHFGLQVFTAASDPTTLSYVAERFGRTRILRWSDSVSHGQAGAAARAASTKPR